jgi:hypothetical protein
MVEVDNGVEAYALSPAVEATLIEFVDETESLRRPGKKDRGGDASDAF